MKKLLNLSWFTGLYILPASLFLVITLNSSIKLSFKASLTILLIPSFIVVIINIYYYINYGVREFDPISLLKVAKDTPSKDKRIAMYPEPPKSYLSKNVDGIVLGKYHNKFVRLQIDNNNIKHAAVIGAPGSGKSATLLISLINNFRKENPDLTFMTVDIKPELAKKSVKISGNPKVKVIDPTSNDGPGWDAYFMIDQNSTDDEVLDALDNIARSLIVSNSPTDKFFIEGAVKILKGILLFEFRNDNDFITSMEKVLEVNLQTKINEILQDEYVTPFHPKIKFLLSEYENADSEAFDDLSMELKMPLSIFMNDSVKYCFKDAEVKATPNDLNNKISIFLALPESKLEQFAGLFRMMIYQTLAFMETRPEDANPVVLLLDEFARLGKIDKIVNALATLRSRRVTIWMLFQDVSQLEKSYGPEWARSIWNLCSIHLVLSCSDIKTNETLSKMAGYYTENKITTNTKRWELTFDNKSHSDMDKRILEVSDIASLREKNEAIVFLDNKYYRIDKVGYYQISELVKYSEETKACNEANSLFRL